MNFSLDLSLLFCILGLLSLAGRFRTWQSAKNQNAFKNEFQNEVKNKTDVAALSVSIIIPCRNEALNLPTLVASLQQITYHSLEIIVVDDSSEDDTFIVANQLLSSFPNYKVVRAPAKPAGWGGKNWPCWIGAQEASGEIFLFTDADTVHSESSVQQAVHYLTRGAYDFISAVPYHSCKNTWEKYLGLFFLLPLLATAFKDKPSMTRVFAIGQYLMFTRKSYEDMGGHKQVASSLAEDIDLALLWMKAKKSYAVFTRPGLYQVQMYSDFQQFLRGWKRLLRLGLHRSTLLSFLEVSMVCYLFGFSFFEAKPELLLVFALSLITLSLTQRAYGRFHFIGILAAPFSVWLFVMLTMAALFEKAFRKDILWHGRSYSS